MRKSTFFGNSRVRKFKVVITDRGLKGSGRYIGRHKDPIKGIFGNPFPTKPSKFSKKVFPLNESLKLYESYLRKKLKTDTTFRKEFEKLLTRLKTEGKVVLDCFCTNTVITSPNHKPRKCHGEVLAVYLLRLAHK